MLKALNKSNNVKTDSAKRSDDRKGSSIATIIREKRSSFFENSQSKKMKIISYDEF